MKKILILILLVLLCACNNTNKSEETNQQRYFDMISLIQDNDSFQEESNYFSITGEITTIDNGYRYYVFVDTPRIAMYDVEIMAIEKEVDYSKSIAANLGILEDNVYSFIPNQTNPSKGYYKGASVSGLSNNPNVKLYILVQWRNKDLSKQYREYITLDLELEG